MAAPASPYNFQNLQQALSAFQLLQQLMQRKFNLGTGLGAANLAKPLLAKAIPGTGPYLGPALGAAALGYNLNELIKTKGLTTQQKAGQSGRLVADTALSATIPYYALAKAVQAVGNELQKSGSPQVRGVGRVASYAAEPAGAGAFWNVATGMNSPRDAIKRAGGFQGALLDTMGPVGLIMRGIGADLPLMNQVPTKGAQFEKALYKLLNFDKYLGTGQTVRTQNIGRTGPTAQEIAQWGPAAMSLATGLGPVLGLLAGAGNTPQLSPAYQQRAGNVLLRNFGANLPTVAPQIFGRLGVRSLQDAQALATKLKLSPEASAAFSQAAKTALGL